MRRLVMLLPLCFAAPAFAQSLTVTYDDCVAITRHYPDADVKYRPDEDPDVAPADLGGRKRIQMPKNFTIPIDVNLQKRFGIPADPTMYTDKAWIGVVEWKDGRAWFNGQPLGADGEREIGLLCRDRMSKR